MPQISSFLGVIIKMFYRDHNPPHFHASYGEYECIFDIEENEIIGGYLPPRVLLIVKEWASIYKAELLKNWEKARNLEVISAITPLV
jgi:hypothetical protein